MEIIKTKRFTLRPYRMSDVSEIAKVLNNWNIIKHLSSLPFPYKEEHAKEYIQKTLTEMRKKGTKNFVMTIVIDGQPSGAVGIHHIENNHKAEMGYWLAEHHWGQGIMPEAVEKFMAHVMKKFNLRRICARIYAHNKGSMRVAEKVGMKFEGIAKKDALKGGKYIDCAVYAKVK